MKTYISTFLFVQDHPIVLVDLRCVSYDVDI
jgi:hypothetical protein